MIQKDNLDFPFYDSNLRRVLDSYSKKIKEKPIETGPYQEGQIEASPILLALFIMLATKNHLNLLLDNSSKIGLQINKKQKIKLYLELLSFYYFLTGGQISQYLKKEQFTLFILKLHVELLNNLPQTKDTLWLFGIFGRKKRIKEIEEKLSSTILKGEKFYIKNKLDENEIKAINELKPILLGEHLKDYEKVQFYIKNFYLLSKILNLSLPQNITTIIHLYLINSTPIIESQNGVIKYLKTTWHSEKQ